MPPNFYAQMGGKERSMQNVIDKIEWMFAGLGGFLGWFFGGFDGFLYALVVFVVCDYFTGVLAAAIKHELSSEIGFKGIAKKVCIFVLVGIANITQQKLKNASDKKQETPKSKDSVDAGIAALILKALEAKKVISQPDIAERLQSSMESDFSKLFIPEETKDSKFVSTATFRATRRKTGTLNVAAYIRVSTDMSDQENS